MKLTKFGHSCFLVEENGVRVLFDPGRFSTEQNTVQNLDAVLITHNHGDHLDQKSLEVIMQNNPKAVIITNSDSAKRIDSKIYTVEIVKDGDVVDVRGLKIEANGNVHKEIYPGIDTPECTGFFVGKRLYNPADSFHNPGRKVDVLMFPITAPMVNIGEALDYIKLVGPTVAIPIHDGYLREPRFIDSVVLEVLEPAGIKFMPLEIGKEYDLP